MAVSLNLTVGILGELSSGPRGLHERRRLHRRRRRNEPAERCPLGRSCASRSPWWSARSSRRIAGVLVGIPVLRLQGDYLAIVTLAFGEIIKNAHQLPHHRPSTRTACTSSSTHRRKTVADLGLTRRARCSSRDRMGATGVRSIARFTAGFILVMVTLDRCAEPRRTAAPAAPSWRMRDNRIAAESVGINVTKYKLMAFVTSRCRSRARRARSTA